MAQKVKYKFFALLFVFLISVGFLVFNGISCNRVDYWLHRAKDAGSPAQVAECLIKYEQALSNKNYIKNKYLTIFKYPASSMEIYKVAIDGLIIRAEALAEQNPTDTSYQMGLVNLEKDLGDIEASAFTVWQASGGFLWWWILGISFIFCLIFGILWGSESY